MSAADPQAAERLRGLCVLADDDPRWTLGPVEQARAACAGGAAIVQLRAKHATDRQALDWAGEIRALTAAAACLFFVNDRFDLALAADADGVHLGQGDLPPALLPDDARRRLLVGRSTHTLDQARAARDETVDYLAFGPIFDTDSVTSEYSARGLEQLAEVVREADGRPVIAIGGIGVGIAGQIAATGAAGAAVISAVAAADDPEAAVRGLVAALRAEPAP